MEIARFKLVNQMLTKAHTYKTFIKHLQRLLATKWLVYTCSGYLDY